MTSFDLSVRFFLQMAFILGVCRLTGWVFRRLGQSQVVSEMIAGVLMGPSLFGWLAPGVSAYVFPVASKPIIFAVSQIGLSLYMFLVGAEFDVDLVRSRIRSAATISAAGILAPFALGAVLALATVGDTTLFGDNVSAPLAVLFMGASLSITAFPMLARIIHEQGLTKTSLGTLALAAGSMDDAAAWCVLAIVLGAFARTPTYAVIAIGGGVAYAVFVLVVMRRALRPLGDLVEREGRMSNDVLLVALALCMLWSWFTDWVRIYAVFGAFLMGIAMPRGLFQRELERKVMPLTTNFLLPLFFVYSGLNTRLGLLDSWRLWALTAVALAAAVGGKFVACMLASRAHGESWKDSVAIGTLMNARGLMELILLNVALERGMIRPSLFSILVMMAIVTTLMATPIFERVYGKRAQQGEESGEQVIV